MEGEAVDVSGRVCLDEMRGEKWRGVVYIWVGW